MLPERYRQLLTACVDGELNRRQRRRVERLLQRSPEARQVLQQLLEDARALRHLPPTPPPADLAEVVLTRIHERRLRPARQALLNNPPTMPAWAGLAAAAAVLVVLGVASYLYFTASFLQPSPTSVARVPQHTGTRTPQEKQTPPPGSEKPAPDDSPKPGTGPGPSQQPSPQPENPADPPVARRPEGSPAAPGESSEERILTGGMEQLIITRVDGSFLPLVFKLTDIARAPGRDQVLAQLHKDSAFRLELPCHNGTRAMERLQAVLHKQQVRLVVDPKAQERLGQPRIVTSYGLYLEDTSAEQLVQLLTELSAEDARVAARHPSEGQLDRLVLRRMSAADHKELAALFGADPTLRASPPQEGKTPLPATRTLLVAPYPATLAHGGTAEMRHYLQTRKSARPGTLAVFLVFRTR